MKKDIFIIVSLLVSLVFLIANRIHTQEQLRTAIQNPCSIESPCSLNSLIFENKENKK